jgi:hypothetical protein
MPYAGLRELRGVLTDHRSWPATVVIFILAFLAAVLLVAVIEWAAGFHFVRWAFWLAALVIALGWTLTDAAHRNVGAALRRR